MTPQEFLDEFGTLAESADGVPKLRETILELAVRGKLVEQNDADEPAATLVEALTDHRSELIKAKKITKKQLPGLNGDLPDLPSGWTWATLSHVGEFCGGGTPSKKNPEFWDGDMPWVSPKDMKSAHITRSQDSITDAALNGTRIREIPVGSILIVARSGILKRTLPVSINDVRCTVNQDLKVVIPFDTAVSEYVRLMLRGHERMILRDLVKGGMTVQSLKYEEFEVHPFPLPPLAEQHRIVSKVDELMGLCDRLEAVQGERRGVRVRLNRSSLDRLTSVSTARGSGLSAAWQRVCDHFEVLYDTPETIHDLKQAILALVLDGSFAQSASNANSESLISELLDCRERTWKESQNGRAAKYKQPVSPNAEELHVLPAGWNWATFDQLTHTVTSGSRGWKKYYADSGSTFVRSQDIKTDVLDLSNPAYVNVPASTEGSRTRIANGDLLVTITGANVAKAAHVDVDLEDAYVSQHVALVRPVDARVSPFMHKWLISEKRGRGILLGRSYGDKPGLNLDNIRTLPIPVPPLPEQKRIVSKVNHLLSQVTRLESTLTRREATRSELLTAAVHSILRGSADNE